MTARPTGSLPPRAAELVLQLGLAPHPEGGYYREIFRSTVAVQPDGQRPKRAALTTIDFLLAEGQFSAWHRVRSDEVWHLLEGQALRLWLMPPTLNAVHEVLLGAVAGRSDGGNGREGAEGGDDRKPRHIVPAGWWQAAEPLDDFAYVGATVAPGFDFEDFSFGRDDAAFTARLRADLRRLL